jgi:murein L,D-transpeptidase YcbB/YkuD
MTTSSVPEASFLDTDWVRQLDEQAIVPRAFTLAALAIDVETPILSADRAKLWSDKILPAQFTIGANGNLIPQVVKNLTALNPAAGTPEAKFLKLLQKPETVAATVQSQVDQYSSREKNLLGDQAKPADRSNEWIRLYKLALKRREAVLADATLKSLDETGGTLLLARGDSSVTVAALPSTTTTPKPVVSRPTVRLGDRGDDVVFLQRRLKALGVFSGTIDGDFGPQTKAAVIAAQQQFNLGADGVVGPATWAALQGTVA